MNGWNGEGSVTPDSDPAKGHPLPRTPKSVKRGGGPRWRVARGPPTRSTAELARTANGAMAETNRYGRVAPPFRRVALRRPGLIRLQIAKNAVKITK